MKNQTHRFKYMTVIGLLVLGAAATIRAANETETRREIEALKMRISEMQKAMNSLDSAAARYHQAIGKKEEFLKDRGQNTSSYLKVVEEAETQIEQRREELTNEKIYQSQRNDRLRRRLGVWSNGMAALGTGGGAKPRQKALMLALRNRCRQLTIQARLGRESLEEFESELQQLVETRDRYEEFLLFAKTDVDELRQTLNKEKNLLDEIEDLKKEKATMISKEQKRLLAMITELETAEKARREEERKAREKAEAERKAQEEAQAAAVENTPARRPPAPGPKAPLGQGDLSDDDYEIKYAAAPNSPVHALADGTIISAGYANAVDQEKVVIAHENGIYTIYSNLSDTAHVLSEGQSAPVTKGQRIGWVGFLPDTDSTGVIVTIYKEVKGGLVKVKTQDWPPTRGATRPALLPSGQ